jgi:hypothetical protein
MGLLKEALQYVELGVVFVFIRFPFFFKFKVGLGGSTNNKVVLIALKHILMLVVQKGVQNYK